MTRSRACEAAEKQSVAANAVKARVLRMDFMFCAPYRWKYRGSPYNMKKRLHANGMEPSVTTRSARQDKDFPERARRRYPRRRGAACLLSLSDHVFYGGSQWFVFSRISDAPRHCYS